MSSEPLVDRAAARRVPLRLIEDSRPRSRTGPISDSRLREPWLFRYVIAVVVSDVLATASVATAGWLVGFRQLLGWDAPDVLPIAPTAGVLVVVLLAVCKAWDATVLGQGSAEFSRVMRAMTTAAVLLGLTGLALQGLAVRPWVFGLLPLTCLLALGGRWLLRKRLHRLRRAGGCSRALLAVGSTESVSDLIGRTRRDVYLGWTVVAVCTTTGRPPAGADSIMGIPVIGDLDSIQRIVSEHHIQVVSVGNAPGLTGTRLHQLAWDLEELGADLVVDPGLMEIAGPRMHVTPVDGLPMLRLTKPSFTGVARVVKKTIDLFAASLLILLLLPLLIATAAVVRLDGGPAFYRQKRLGLGGQPFYMIKFRSMVVDADRRLSELVAANQGAGPMFKMRDDPRVTPIGRLMRRYSVDELPQLFNVLLGSMSLVGPRPPLPEEVASYGRDATRKFLVKPGLTGLWQVSGRSNLSWEESVRLDLRYVENWTLAQDIQILWKTIGAVFGKSGAY